MKLFLRKHFFIVALLFIFITLNTWAVCAWYSTQLNPDGLSYITLAQKYASFDIKHAINGYWGPLLSLIMVPFVWVGANMIIVGKLISLFAAAAILALTYWILLRNKINRTITYSVSFIMAVLLTEWAVYSPITPDMLMALWIVLLGIGVNEFLKRPSRNLGIALGALGGIIYLTKGFGFYLFIATIGVVALYQWWFEDRRQYKIVLRRYLALAIVFLAITLPFIGILSVKYHKLTVNNAGTFNWNVYGVHGRGTQPIDNYGPFVPPNDTALSAWEDPTPLSNTEPNWSVLDSRTSLAYFIKDLLWLNFNTIFNIMRGFGGFVIFSFIIMIITCFRRGLFQRESLIFALINGLMFCGYSVIFIDSRYLWGGMVLAVISGAVLLNTLHKKQVLTVLQLAVGGFVIGGSLLLTITQAIVGSRDAGADLYSLAQQIRPEIPKGTHVMSDRFAPAFPVCYHLELKCYNVMDPPADKADDYYRLIKGYGVTYYLDFHQREDDANLKSFIDRYGSFQYEYTAKGTTLTVYKLN